MSHDELRAEYARLKARVAKLLEEHPAESAGHADLLKLLEESQTLAQEYDEKLTVRIEHR